MTTGIYTCRSEVTTLVNVDWSDIVLYDWPTKKDFLNSTHDYKVAIIEFDYSNPNSFVELATEFVTCDLVLVLSMESTSAIIKLIKQFDLPNFTFIINSIFNFSLSQAKVIYEFPWLTSTANPYLEKHKSLLKDKLAAFAPKPYAFEVMYGRFRKHRCFVYERLSDHDKQFYQAPFFDDFNGKDVNTSYNFDKADLWEDEIILSKDTDYQCLYYDDVMHISQVLPFKIYNKTAYSLICETSTDNEWSFFTEKIVKPIIAHRLFIVISGQYYLKNLRSLGFKTFDSIIDESYDVIQDPKERWHAAIQSAVTLAKQDQRTVLDKVIPIAIHNFHMLKYLKTNSLAYELELFLLEKGHYTIGDG